MTERIIKGKPYLFEWNDTYSENGWLSEDQLDEKTLSTLHKSVGYLVKENPDWYIIAMHKNDNSGFLPWALVSWIPKGAVKKISSLR